MHQENMNEANNKKNTAENYQGSFQYLKFWQAKC